MALFNHTTKELTAKIVYYGPGLCGKTTNLRVLQGQLDRVTKGRLLSLATAQDRTIYFDLLPIELGNIKGYTVRFQLCTVPGQVFYNETRKIVLRGVDGIVFVVDSQWSMLSHNLESFQNLKENLGEEKVAFGSIPFVVQYNKRDLPGAMSIEALQDALGFSTHPHVEAIAADGKGVVETFRLASKLTFVDLLRRLQKGVPASAETAAAALAAASAAIPTLATPQTAEMVFATPESEAAAADAGVVAPAVAPAPAKEAAEAATPAAVGVVEAAPEGAAAGTPPPSDVALEGQRSWPTAPRHAEFPDLDDDVVLHEGPSAAPPPPPADMAPRAPEAASPHEPVRISSPGPPLVENAAALSAIERIRKEVEERRLRMQLETRAIASSEIPKNRLAGLFPAPKPAEPPAPSPGVDTRAGETQQIDAIRPDDGEVRRLEESLTRAIRSIDEETGQRREAESRLNDRIAALEAEIARLSAQLSDSRGREESLKALTEGLTKKWDALRRLLSEDPVS